MVETEEAVRRFLDGEEEAFNRIVRQLGKENLQSCLAYAGQPRGRPGYRPGDISFRLQIHQELARTGQLFNLGLPDHPESLPGPADDLAILLSLEDDQHPIRPGKKSIFFPLPDLRENSGSSWRPGYRSKGSGGLSEDHRTAIVLKEYMGLSLEELADVMECPLSTAKSRLYHGIRDVQRNLKRLGFRLEG